MTLTDWCARPHHSYGARISNDALIVWAGGSPYAFPSPPGASITIPVSTLFWRERVAETLAMLRRSLRED